MTKYEMLFFVLDFNRQQLTLQLDDPLKRSGKVPLARYIRMIADVFIVNQH